MLGTNLRDTARAMSQENVEIVRAAFEAWNAGDMDALRELYDPDVIVRHAGGLAGAGALRGPGGRHAPVRAAARGLGRRRRGTDQRLHRRRRPSCREVHLAWRGPRP